MSVEILRVSGIRSDLPVVIAIVDGTWCVKWKPDNGWTCVADGIDCELAESECFEEHIDPVIALLDPRVLG